MDATGRAPSEGAASNGLIPLREGGNVMEMQRRRLLLAIGEVVSEDGLEAASVGRVCKRAGMSRRTFYELFEDREACLQAAFELAIERIAESVVHAYRGERRWRRRVRAALRAMLECFDLDPGLARLCLVETLKAGPEALEYRRRVLDVLSHAIDDARREAKNGAGLAPLTAESTVGGVLAVLHARVLTHDPRPLMELLNPLMSMIVHPYLGPVAAKRELGMPVAESNGRIDERTVNAGADPFRDLPIRFTYRTARVLATIAAEPGINNRQVGDAAGVHDQGQMSKLLRRLQRNGLIANQDEQPSKGEPNAWTLTERGKAVHNAIGVQAGA
jgi:AcrR family transcriptional regulator